MKFNLILIKFYFILLLFVAGLFLFPKNAFGCSLLTAAPLTSGCSSGWCSQGVDGTTSWVWDNECFGDGTGTGRYYEGPAGGADACTCGGGSDGGGSSGDRVIGGVSKDGVRVNNFDYTITSADSKTAGWETDQNGNRMYTMGTWLNNTPVSITLTNPNAGYGCSWSFGHPNDAGNAYVETATGQNCTANVTISGGAWSPEWRNNLSFALAPSSGTITASPNPCGTDSNNSCSTTLTWSSNVNSIELCGANSTNNYSTNQVWKTEPNGTWEFPWISLGTTYRFTLRQPSGGACTGSVLSSVDVTALQPPTNLTASCPSPGTTATTSWDGPSNATTYAFRSNDTSNGWNGSCTSPNPGDICGDVSAKSYSFDTVAGRTYSWWVHTCTAQTCTYGVSGTEFICYPPPSISGTVFTDTDNDGEKDTGESGYTGATVSLSGPTTRSPVTTGADGAYSFTDLTAGTYTITVNGVTNYKFTTPSSCTSLSQGTNCPESVVISALDKTLDFGIIPVYSVQGTIFGDINKDEIMNAGESGYTGGTSTIEVRNPGLISCSGDKVTSVGTGGIISTNNGVFNTDKNLIPGNYDICYTSLAEASQYVLTYPNNGGTPFFPITVGTSCSVGSHNAATCSSGNIINLNFGISNNYAWYQCIGADCRDDGGVTDIVPDPTDPTYATCGTNPNYYAAIPQAVGGTHGIIFSGENSYSFCAGAECPERSSSSQWLVGKASLGGKSFAPIRPGVMRTSYGSFTALAQQNDITPTPLTTTQCGTGDISSCDLSTDPTVFPNGIYISNGNLTLTNSDPTNTYTFPANKNYVILVNGDLTIETNIKVPTSSTVTFSVSGDITVDRTIGESTPYTSTNSNIEGFYSTDKSFIIDGYGVGGCVAGGTRDKRLNIAGSVVANAGLTTGAINNGRDLCEANLQCPSYSITERPDFILNAPDFIKHPNYIWQEVAP